MCVVFQVRDDLSDLITALNTVKQLRQRDARDRERSILDRATVRTISAKVCSMLLKISDFSIDVSWFQSGLAALLQYYGYVLNNNKEYVFHTADTPSARDWRRNGMNEVEDLWQDLIDARKGSLTDLNDFIGV